MKTLVLVFLVGLVGLLGVLGVRTLTFDSAQVPVEAPFTLALDRDAVLDRFAGSIVYRTISGEEEATTETARQFLGLHRYFQDEFPLVHEHLGAEPVNGLSLLYTWEGSDPELPPIVLLGHMDVVPVVPGTEDDWTHPPYSGTRADGYVWGRGTMDDKISVVALLEAVETLLRDGVQPERTVYLAFGHDEEIGGAAGTVEIRETLAGRGVDRFGMVLDEGGAIADGLIPGVSGPVAVVGVAEKGGVNLTLKVEGPGGHSSTPPPRTNIGILAAAIAGLESEPFPMEITGPSEGFFEAIGPEMELLPRMALANRWLLESLVVRELAASPSAAAMLRTTTAATIIAGGVKSNVLPITATATVNFRIVPGQTPESVRDRVVRVIADPRVQVTGAESGRPPSPVSSTDTEAWQTVSRTVREVAGSDVVVAPYLVIGGTDARHWAGTSESVYRFLPARMEADALSRVHGTDERMSEESYLDSVTFFYRLIESFD